jgi:hypothetical protein
VERRRRVTIFTVPVLPLDDHARIVERLVLEARKRAIRIHTLLSVGQNYSMNSR